MVPITQFQVILFLLSLLYFTCRSEDTESDFDKWISWNVKNYQTNSILEHKWNVNATGQGLDLKLREAERNKITKTVNQDGSAQYKTITEAVNSIPPHNTRRVIVSIAPGVYREKIEIPKTKFFVTFLGDASDRPTITGNDTSKDTRKDGTELNTYGSATVGVNASYFNAINIIFENNAKFANESMNEQQAVALRISGNYCAFYNCSFIGAQDTLYDHKGIHYFKNCSIQGTVDFICGYGRSLYENCIIKSMAKNGSSITAQKRTEKSIDSGFSFKNSIVTGSTGNVYLGRPWGNYSRVIFSYTYMGKIVLPQGWSAWKNETHNKTVYYGEYKCSGPGSNLSRRVPWTRVLTDEEVQPFIGTHFIYGNTWLINP